MWEIQGESKAPRAHKTSPPSILGPDLLLIRNRHPRLAKSHLLARKLPMEQVVPSWGWLTVQNTGRCAMLLRMRPKEHVKVSRGGLNVTINR